MALKIKDEYLQKIIEQIKEHNLYFENDGCACGELEIKLNDQLYLSAYRSCRKSGSTPDEKLWHIHEFEFNSEPRNSLLEAGIPFEPINMKLDSEQTELLLSAMKEASREIWGNEYRNEDLL